MNFTDLSIKRPVFISCLVIMMLVAGYFFSQQMSVDLFPNVEFPYVSVTTIYPGAAPAEIEALVSKPLEEEIGTISGLKHISSYSMQGFSMVWAEFTLETDAKWAEQQIRDKVGIAKGRLPKDIEEPLIQRFGPSDMPIILYSLNANLSESELFDIADQYVRPKLEQVDQVSAVKVFGGRKREIFVKLDREKLRHYEISAGQVVQQLAAAGENIPLGKSDAGNKEVLYRSISQFGTIDKIKTTIVRFLGNDIPVTIGDIGKVEDGLKDETTRAYVSGNKALFFFVYRQSGANTVEVVDRIIKRIGEMKNELSHMKGKPELTLIRDGSTQIRDNILDVKESIFIGIILAVIVVFIFLANIRSTIITSLALPNSLIGAFVLMYLAGFSINMMSLLALSLAVGLLVDDAIVVRENIFRHMEMGKDPLQAAKDGSEQVKLAVIATTCAVLAVFVSIAFVKGIVGQFLKEFGLTVSFAMLISLFDALTVAPMLSAYFGGIRHERKSNNPLVQGFDKMLASFNTFQDWLEEIYVKLLKRVLHRPIRSLAICFVIFLASISTLKWVSMTFMPVPDLGEYEVKLEFPPGTNLNRTDEISKQIDATIRKNKAVALTALTTGTWSGEANKASIYVSLLPFRERGITGSTFKNQLREELKSFSEAKPQISEYDPLQGGLRPFTMQIVGTDPKQTAEFGEKVLTYLKENYPNLTELTSDNQTGKPEYQVVLDSNQTQKLGVSGNMMGQELRIQLEGMTAAKFRENGREYDIRVRLQDEQRFLENDFNKMFIPNVNYRLISLDKVAKGVNTTGPTQIMRQDRMSTYQISGDFQSGVGLGEVLDDLKEIFKTKIQTPLGVNYKLLGEAELYEDMVMSMVVAAGLGILFIYLVLASLYESFIIPFTIMLALPLALCGAFIALLITKESLNLLSMIGCIMLLGIATKNSILLVDYANQLVAKGIDRTQALLEAGKTRLRPILMTTMALIAGTIPIAIGLNESSRQRTSMGIAIIGGLVTSTLLTLVVVPAAYSYLDRFRNWALTKSKKSFTVQNKSVQE